MSADSPQPLAVGAGVPPEVAPEMREDEFSNMVWRTLFAQRNMGDTSDCAALMRSLSHTCGDLTPLPMAHAAVWDILSEIDSVPVPDQAAILVNLSAHLHVAPDDLDCTILFKNIVEFAKGLPDPLRADVYTALLEKSSSMVGAILNYAFIAILRATDTMKPAAASRCADALIQTLSHLAPSSRTVAAILLAARCIDLPAQERNESLLGLMTMLDALPEGIDRYWVTARMFEALTQQHATVGPAVISRLAGNIEKLPIQRRLLAFNELLALASKQPPSEQAENVPHLNCAFVRIEEDVARLAPFDSVSLPDPQRPDARLVEMVASLACWAMQDKQQEHFPADYLQKVCAWAANGSVEERAAFFGRLCAQLQINASLIECGVRLDQDPSVQLQEFSDLMQTLKILPDAVQANVVDAPLRVVQAAQQENRPYLEALREQYMAHAANPLQATNLIQAATALQLDLIETPRCQRPLSVPSHLSTTSLVGPNSLSGGHRV